jgi:hypothetical protein
VFESTSQLKRVLTGHEFVGGLAGQSVRLPGVGPPGDVRVTSTAGRFGMLSRFPLTKQPALVSTKNQSNRRIRV